MQIGTIVSLAGGGPSEESALVRNGGGGVFPRSARAVLDVLGQSLLERKKARARQFAGGSIHIVPESPSAISVLPSRSAKSSSFVAAWENAVAHYIKQGVEQLLLLRAGVYTDLDFSDLLEFHLERGSRLTQAYSPSGALDIALVSTEALRNGDDSYRRALAGLIPRQERFFYRGYVNLLRTPHDLAQLVEDGLTGRCQLRPLGIETSPGIWIAPGAQIKDTVRISGPAFIGAGTRINDCCTITGPTTIERGCEIDCGTNVSQSCILPGSYVGVALELKGVIVNQGRLFHQDRNIDLEIGDTRLISSQKGLVSSQMRYFDTYGVQ